MGFPTRPMPMYNKLHGLRFLKRALRNEEAKVLPYRVYYSHKQVEPEHFGNTKRALIRMDTTGEIRKTDWSQLPRIECKPKEVKNRVEEALKDAQEICTRYGLKPRAIVHPVQERKDYLIAGKVAIDNGHEKITTRICADAINKSTVNWRFFIENALEQNEPSVSKLVELGLKRKHAKNALKQIKESVDTLIRQNNKEGFIPKTHVGEAWFTVRIAKDKPLIEYYDFLRISA